MPLRTLLVDDNSRFLRAARELLEREGMEVLGVASTSEEAVRLAGALRPDVCLVDIDLGDESGFDLARRLAQADGHSPRVMLISAYPERDFTDLIADSPAVGFLPKSEISAARILELLAEEA
ncbi:MAG TPA: response regulator transcription factor [Thermoleophilaceae bacterium]|nr:response regulator transcription factor [Thermoleophilaceae bacterium]